MCFIGGNNEIPCERVAELNLQLKTKLNVERICDPRERAIRGGLIEDTDNLAQDNIDFHGQQNFLRGIISPLIMELDYKVKTGKISPTDILKLDFTFADEAGFGSNPDYEVFNPDSPRTLFPEATHFAMPSSLIRPLTTSREARLLLISRQGKNEESGTRRASILGFVTYYRPDLCKNEHIEQAAGHGIDLTNLQLPDKRVPAASEAFLSFFKGKKGERGCFVGNNGQAILYFTVYSRDIEDEQ